MLYADFGSNIKSAVSLLILSDSRYVFCSTLLFPVFLSYTLWHIWQELSILSSSFQVTHFFRVMTRPMSWPDEVRCFSQFQFLVSLFLPLVFTHFFFWRGGVPFLNFLTHRYFQFHLTYASSSRLLCPLSASLQRTVFRETVVSRKGKIENPL